MEYRQLGTSDVKVSVIALGAWAIGGTMWGGQDESDAIAAIETAIDLGVTTIDTAAVYGFGLSEELIGKAIQGKRDKVQILTKYAMRWDKEEGQFGFEWTEPDGQTYKIYKNARKESVIWECEQSLKRLAIDCIDLFQCHCRDETTAVEETMEAIAQLLKDGKIRASGVSNFSVPEIEAANNAVPLASDQPSYSMLRRDIEADILPYCREHNIGVLAYSPLQGGLLTGKITEDYKFNQGDHRAKNRFFTPENVRKVNAFLDKIRPIADAHNATLGQLAISWTINRPGITAALVGARNSAQAAENAHAADIQLTAEQTSRIDELLLVQAENV